MSTTGSDASTTAIEPSIGGAAFWIRGDADASPVAPGVGSVRMILSVEDPDALFERAVGGAAAVAPVHDEHGWQRTGRLTDPLGHDWKVSKRL
jgi:PhnB protein